MKIIIPLIIILTLFSCNNQSQNKSEQEPIKEAIILPDNAIPFIYKGGVIMDIKVNDSIMGSFLFDTGSDQLYLDSSFVANNNILTQKGRTKEISGVGANTPRVPVSDNIKLEIDSLTITYNNVPVLNLNSIRGEKIDGIFGIDIFRSSVLRINFDSSYFQIIKPSDFVIPSEHDSLKITIAGNKTFIKCKALILDSLNVDGFAMLDLGSGHNLTFTSVIAHDFNFNDNITNKYSVTHKNAGYGGDSHSYYFRAKKLNIGKYTLENPVMNYSTDESGGLSMWGPMGLIGIGVMKRFDLIFDFPNKKLYFKPNSLFNEHFFSSTTGFTGKYRESDSVAGFIIGNVIENSPASAAGIKPGDIITHLNGLEILSYPDTERNNLFLQDTMELEFKIKRGTESHIVKFVPREML